jgi:hypothetical protein
LARSKGLCQENLATEIYVAFFLFVTRIGKKEETEKERKRERGKRREKQELEKEGRERECGIKYKERGTN